MGTEFAKYGSWDSHIQKVINSGKKKLNKIHRFLSNRNMSTVTRTIMLVLVLRSTLEYGSEVWACNKRQTAPLESINSPLSPAVLASYSSFFVANFIF